MNPQKQISLDAIVIPSTRPANSRRQPYSMAYTLLLILTTLVAATFCYLYLSKPVVRIMTAPRISLPAPATKTETPGKGRTISPATDPALAPSAPKAPTHGTLEETNLRIQHVLTAESPDGRIDRIELTVPVLYRSRALLWTEREVASARELHRKLADHRAKTQALREEGAQLLEAWNRLVADTIPQSVLRADSPSLPSNQQNTVGKPRAAGWSSQNLIEVKPAKP